MKLSADEERFLRHWIYDEAHFQDGRGTAKSLQLQYQALPADLALLISAGIPNIDDQLRAANDPPDETEPKWPWPNDLLRLRVDEARSFLHRQLTASAKRR